MAQSNGQGAASDPWGSSEGTLELIVDQLEELVVSIIDELRERPMVAAAIFAGILGAILGIFFATRSAARPKRRVTITSGAGAELLGALAGVLAGAGPRVKTAAETSKKVGKRSSNVLGGLGDMSDLAGLGVRLFENPLVRSYLRAAVVSQLRRRFR